MLNVFLLNWNSIELIAERLLEIDSFDNKKILRVFLINNDESKIVKSDFSNLSCELHIINNCKNLGYTGGNNSGLSYLNDKAFDGDILILNPDVSINSHLIDEFIEALKPDNVGAVMPIAFNESQKLLYRAISMNGFFEKRIKYASSNSTTIINTDYVAGSCFALKRDALEKTYLFDDDYFLYWEEVDLSLRLRALGYNLVSTQTANVKRESNDIDRQVKSQYYLLRNSFILRRKFPSLFSRRNHFLYLSFRLYSVFKLCLLSKRLRVFIFAIEGVCDGVRGKYGQKKN